MSYSRQSETTDDYESNDEHQQLLKSCEIETDDDLLSCYSVSTVGSADRYLLWLIFFSSSMKLLKDAF